MDSIYSDHAAEVLIWQEKRESVVRVWRLNNIWLIGNRGLGENFFMIISYVSYKNHIKEEERQMLLEDIKFQEARQKQREVGQNRQTLITLKDQLKLIDAGNIAKSLLYSRQKKSMNLGINLASK